MKKKYFIACFIAGYIICSITHLPRTGIIVEKISPNNDYRLCYEWKRQGGILIRDYNFYVTVYENKSGKYILSQLIYNDDEFSGNEYYKDDVFWDGDTIVLTENDFGSKDNNLKQIVISDNKTCLRFEKGFATE